MRLVTLLVLTLCFLCASCASAPPPAVLVSGNGTCHPSDDLPAHKAVPRAPETDTPLVAFLQWMVGERKQYGQDVRDYNSLYAQCVSPKP